MNDNRISETLSDVPWPTSRDRMSVPDTSMLPGSEKAPSPAVELLNHAADGAHDALDRMAGGAAPAARRLDDRLSAAGSALRAGRERLRDKRNAWKGGARASVRRQPLASLAAAMALGAVISRLARWGSGPR